MMKIQILLCGKKKQLGNKMLFLKVSYGDIVKLIDNETDQTIAALTIRGVDNTQGVDIFNLAVDSSRRYKIVKTLLKQQFSFDDEGDD